MKMLLCCSAFLFFGTVAFAQNVQRGKISVKVFNEQKKSIEGATAELLKIKDSSLVKTAFQTLKPCRV
jgi:hypothetical protein